MNTSIRFDKILQIKAYVNGVPRITGLNFNVETIPVQAGDVETVVTIMPIDSNRREVKSRAIHYIPVNALDEFAKQWVVTRGLFTLNEEEHEAYMEKDRD